MRPSQQKVGPQDKKLKKGYWAREVWVWEGGSAVVEGSAGEPAQSHVVRAEPS